MNEKLAATGVESKSIVYERNNHAFFSHYRPGYVRANAEASWAGVTRWLAGHGV